MGEGGPLWYETLRDSRLRPNTGFRSFARLTYSVAGRLFKDGSKEQQSVKEAWGKVGIAIK